MHDGSIVSLLDTKGASIFTNDVFTRKGQSKIAAEDIIRKKFNKLTKAEKETFQEIRSKYMCEKNEENYEEEKCAEDETQTKPQKKWWIKSTEVK